MTKAVETVAKEFAKVRFMLIDSAVKANNADSAVFKEQEGSYLDGLAAAMTSKSQKVSFIGGKTTVVDYRERNTCPV